MRPVHLNLLLSAAATVEIASPISLADSSSSSSLSGDGKFNVGLFVPIIGVSILLLLGGMCCYCTHRQWKKSEQTGSEQDGYTSLTAIVSFSRGAFSDVGSGQTIQLPGLISAEHDERVVPMPPREAYELGSDSGPHYVWKMLTEDPNLASKKLWYDQVKVRMRLAKSQSREVRLAEYRGRKVVIKRLLKSKRSQSLYVQEFVCQTQLRAALAHPNIVAFIGVAWDGLSDLMMVMEFLSGGDLATCLHRFGDTLSWEFGKFRIAVGLARALAYLHEYVTLVMHRDLRASNVLLTHQMDAKLTGFDSSCASEDSHRSHTIGASFWAAPEVLRGLEYTEKSDIYAFGVLLAELDTAQAPYHDTYSSIGVRLKPEQILNEVTQGTLRPSFSQECPRRIRVIGVGCYQQDPQRRPTAQQLLRMLRA